MRLKQDENLSIINFSANGDASQDIIEALVRHGVILEDDDSIYGQTIRQAWEYKMSDELIRDILLGICKESNNELVQAFKNLVIMGDGDCPMCGCDMVLDDMKCSTYGDGINERREHEVTSETYLCPNCGYEHTEYSKR